jgi:transcriptional regulator with XRE-family HTH domain
MPRKKSPVRVTLGEAIRAARQAAGLTQVELAARLGVAQSRLSEWERGAVVPGTPHLVRLTEALGLTLIVDGAGARFGAEVKTK